MKKFCELFACLLFAGLILAGCKEATGEAEGKIKISGNSALLLPPGNPGTLSGSTIVLPAESTPPAIHYANCFSGVPNLYDFGIGSSVGASQTYIGYAVLPVNVNLGDTVLSSYRVRVTVTDPALAIDPANILGSNPLLGSGNCVQRGCPLGCQNTPAYYPADEFSPASGFEDDPAVTGTADGVTIEATDADPGNPTTGVVNLCNVRVNIVGDLPAGGADVSFSVDLLETTGGSVTANPLSGVFISHFSIQ